MFKTVFVKRAILLVLVIFLFSSFVACEGQKNSKENMISQDINSSDTKQTETMNKIQIAIGDYSFTATLENNDAANELFEIIKKSPVILELEDYSGFEKVGSLGFGLTPSDKKITTQSGDIVLYNGDNIVLFYASNTWSYTKLGAVDNLKNWEKALGDGSVTVTLSI